MVPFLFVLLRNVLCTMYYLFYWLLESKNKTLTDSETY
jgi:hypothetical protein